MTAYAESQLLLSLLDELVTDIKLISTLPTREADLPLTLPEDVQYQLSEHLQLEAQLEADFSEEVVFNLRNSTRLALMAMFSVQWEKQYAPQLKSSPTVDEFVKVMVSLQELTSSKLHTSIEESLSRFQSLRDTVSRQQHATADVKALNRELQAEQNARSTEAARRDAIINQLLSDIEQTKKDSEHEERQFNESLRAQRAALQSQYDAQTAALEADFAALTEKLKNVEDKNFKEESALRQERRRRDQFLEGLLAQYDVEMGDKYNELENLGQQLRTDAVIVDEKTADMKAVEVVVREAEEEAKMEALRVSHRRDLLKQQQQDAAIIQAFFRGYLVRNSQKKQKPRGKKAGKNSGKKKSGTKSGR